MSADRQSRLLGDLESETTTIETEGRVLRPALAIPDAVVDECKIALRPEGVRTRAVDPANVCMVDLTIHPAAFESYTHRSDGELLVGMNLDRLTGSLGNCRYGKQSSDPVTLDIDSGRTVVEITRTYDTTAVRYADEVLAIDPNSVRQRPDLPDLELPLAAEVPVDALADAVSFCATDHDHVTLRRRGDAMQLTTAPHEDSDSEFGSAVSVDDAIVRDKEPDADPVAKYSADYVTDVVDALQSALVTDVRVVWGDEFPARFEFERQRDGDVLYDGEFMMAPRISSGSE